MKLNELPKLVSKKSKRVGRGYGSGKGGHASSRGQKGQKARSKVPIWFEGGQLPFIRRLPFIKGKNRFKSFSKLININVRDLEILKAGTTVSVENLVKHGIISQANSKHPIKILGRGKLTKSLKVGLQTSMQAAEKIKKAGGEIISNVVEKPPKK